MNVSQLKEISYINEDLFTKGSVARVLGEFNEFLGTNFFTYEDLSIFKDNYNEIKYSFGKIRPLLSVIRRDVDFVGFFEEIDKKLKLNGFYYNFNEYDISVIDTIESKLEAITPPKGLVRVISRYKNEIIIVFDVILRAIYVNLLLISDYHGTRLEGETFFEL